MTSRFLPQLNVILILILALLACWSCSREEVYNGPDIEIELSRDTLRFDTVFTTIGSATRSFLIYNKLSIPVNIEEITIENPNSFFRMNADGISGSTVADLTIQANDSIYVFIEVTVDPDNPASISPFVIEDKILIRAGEKITPMVLEAWGQNANYLPTRNSAGEINLLSCNLGNVIWDDPKPYVIYGILVIDSCTIEIPPGTEIYVHGGIVRQDDLLYNDGLIAFLSEGSLKAIGEPDRPIVFQGDRLEPEFQDIAGQWSGLRFFQGSTDNEMENILIKNSIVGIRVDSTAALNISKSSIINTSSSGIIGYSSEINLDNCLLYNNSGNGLQLVNGGNYEIVYTTISSYNNQAEGLVATNYVCTDPLCSEEIYFSPLNISIVNCVIDGNADSEIFLDDITRGEDPSFFEYSIQGIQTKLEAPEENIYFQNCETCFFHTSQEQLFLDINENNYRLDSMSVARNKAIPLVRLNTDIIGNVRDQNFPDLGCYEHDY